MPEIAQQDATVSGADTGHIADQERTQDAGIARPQDDAQQDQRDQQQAEGQATLTPEQKEQRKAQRRIERLAAQRTEARTEVQILRERLAQLEARQQPQDQGNGNQQQPGTGTADDIKTQAAAMAQEILDQKEVSSRLREMMVHGRKLEGFGAAVDALHEEVPITDRQGRPTEFFRALMGVERPDDQAALMHYLGNNPDEAAEYRGLNPAQIGRRLAKLEDRLKRDAKQQTSNAPPPLRGVTPRSAPSKSLLDLSPDEYAKARRKQLQGS